MVDSVNEQWYRTSLEIYTEPYFGEFELPDSVRDAAEHLNFRCATKLVTAPSIEERCAHGDDDCGCGWESVEVSSDPDLVEAGNTFDWQVLTIIEEYRVSVIALKRKIDEESATCAAALEALRPVALDLDRRLHRLPRTAQPPA